VQVVLQSGNAFLDIDFGSIGAGMKKEIEGGGTLSAGFELNTEELIKGGSVVAVFKAENSTDYLSTDVGVRIGLREDRLPKPSPQTVAIPERAYDFGFNQVNVPVLAPSFVPLGPQPPWLPEGWTTITVPDIPAYIPPVPQGFRTPEIPSQAIEVVRIAAGATFGVITIAGGVLAFPKTGCFSGVKKGAQQIKAAFY